MGYSVWDHDIDYKYWINLEYNDQKYYIYKNNIVKYIIKNYYN